MKKTAIIFLFFFLYVFSFSQENDRRCYLHEMTQINKANFPAQKTFRNDHSVDFTGEYFVIPVVVHIIHQGGEENLSDERVLEQIEILNQDFGGFGPYNNDPRAIDTRIRFCLAKKDPQGNPTTGINRVNSPYADLNPNNEMLTKNLSRWSPHKYLNIWVVKSIDGQSNIQGYSYLASDINGPEYRGDGLVIVHTFFGRRTSGLYNLGRTTTHEIGHYLDLKHPWGGDGHNEGGCDDDDGIDDTPLCEYEYFSSPPLCRHPTQCGKIRLIENFMDYSYDECMSLFTEGQALAMRETIRKYRVELVSSENVNNTDCVSIYDSLNAGNISIFPNPLNAFSTKLNIKTYRNLNTSRLDVYIFDIYGRLVYEEMYPDVGVRTTQIDLPHLRPGLYILKVHYSGKDYKEKLLVN